MFRRFNCSGLVNRTSNKPVPLKNISVNVEVKGFVADVVSTLVYKNEEENPIEAVFVFPMHDDCAVYKFEATVDGKTVVAEIQEKQQARDTYDDAISSGQEAFLLEQDESSSDVFTCTVGNLPPKQEATVGLAFVMELPLEADGAVRFVLPGVLNPRYTPQGFDQGQVTQQVPRVPMSEVPYKLEMDASIKYPHEITKVESNSTITPLQYLNSDKTSAKVSLDQGHQFNKDVELLIYYSDVHKPSICLESGLETAEAGTLMGDATLMLNFYPSIPENTSQSNMWEFIFVVDRSGSMACPMNNKSHATRISSAKETLLFLLKSLPLGCYFNIYGFGSHYESFFSESREYTQDSMQEALEKVEKMEANFGGTEILQPLQDIYKKACVPGRLRQVFIFTDGEVGNTKQVILLVKKHSTNHRCFSFGIGEGASTALVKGIAKAANGTAEFITGSERMQPKVLQSLKRALQSSVKDISVSWQLPSGVKASLLSKAPVVMFQNQRSIIYAQLKGKLDEKAEGHASVEYIFEDQKCKESLQFRLEPERSSRLTVHHLAGKRMISELEEGEHENSDEVKKRITALSLQTGIISSHTAFVAINKELNQPIKGPLIRRDIPIGGYMMPKCRSIPVCLAAAPVKVVEKKEKCMKMNTAPAPAALLCYAEMPPMYNRKLFGGSESDTKEDSCCFDLSYNLSVESAAVSSGAKQELHKQSLSKHFRKAIKHGEGSVSEVSKKEESSPTVKLVSLQNADGSWKLDKEFAAIMKLSEKELSSKIPKQEIDSSVWATVLAIVWLHAFGAELKDEWELLVGKALTWVKGHAGSNLRECSKAASDLLKTPFKPEIFGL
ncbi:von Willebrand factor A domain-containing protein 5A-like isoform X2 [Protopterus annectens]|uniref:von Willebrand factor A domain-containing protein 5A-like isoform X2 n=1 Tax=Protopterus annectens TaxID=7888 RepID=UPI001CFB123A|nr:von Willebrand factor A domain-containing protein 5A-like isoform X2 [Protopterus annectens]